uniref:Phosphodiester glycosidase domain-containing protein n=1 Tax=Amphimedon queenslandica TaxID=400682 RepID=A0A1X7TUU5_AMPQE
MFYLKVNLFQFADMLIKRGVVNAVNLDGGGSSLLMEGDTILNYPGDYWYHIHINNTKDGNCGKRSLLTIRSCTLSSDICTASLIDLKCSAQYNRSGYQFNQRLRFQ